MDKEPGSSGERIEVQDQLVRLFIAMDEGRWEDVTGCFAERVLFDLSSVGSKRPTRTTRERVVEVLEERARGMASVHHQLGNLLVDVGDQESSAFCYCIEVDYFPNETGESIMTLVGTYDLHLSRVAEGWKVDAFRFNLRFAYGNPLLSELAKKSARRRPSSDKED